jgi:hypothetical protein
MKSLSVSDRYLIGGRMPLGVLAHIAGAMLNALEAHHVLYEDHEAPTIAAAA